MLSLLNGCAKPSTEQIALSSGFSQKFIQTTPFKIASYQKMQQPGANVTIYIEGDGNAWRSRTRLSEDPSPRSATVMSLASIDPSTNVVYLARPCQYSPQDLPSVCQAKYWSIARYAPTIVTAMNQAISAIKQDAKAPQINLIGYSGGATIAVLVAAQRNDIASIRTIAGNLDLTAMEKYHHTTPLSESLDPIDVASKVKHIPQLHFVGAKDKVVPEVVVKNFVRAEGLAMDRVMVLAKVDHANGWLENWPHLLELKYE